MNTNGGGVPHLYEKRRAADGGVVEPLGNDAEVLGEQRGRDVTGDAVYLVLVDATVLDGVDGGVYGKLIGPKLRDYAEIGGLRCSDDCDFVS